MAYYEIRIPENLATWLWIGGGVGAYLGWIWLRSTLSELKRLKQLGLDERAAQNMRQAEQAEIDGQRKALQAETDRLRQALQVETDRQRETLAKQQQFVSEMVSAFRTSYVSGRRWLAEFITQASHSFEGNSYPSIYRRLRLTKCSDQVRQLREDKRQLKQDCLLLEYQIKTYEEYFPELVEYREAILNEQIVPEALSAGDDENIDRTQLYLSKEEYLRLTPSERNQLALDRYLQRNLPDWEIGRFYERYVGWHLEQRGYQVAYHGALLGLADLGRDLVAIRHDHIAIVQAKCWAQQKQIREKYIYSLFGTATHYKLEEASADLLGDRNVISLFVTTTNLSEEAKRAAEHLGVQVLSPFPLRKDFPMLKCNINRGTGEKIYHLPFDQQYDRVLIESERGEFYAMTVADAEAKGFRRAHRWRGTAQ